RERGRHGSFSIVPRQCDERLVTLKLVVRILEILSSRARHRTSVSFASRKCYGCDARIRDDSFDLIRSGEQCLKRALHESGASKNVFDRERALGNVGSVLEDADVSGHQRRRGKSKDLPERKIPRHDGEYDTERLKRHPACATFHLHWLIGEKSLGVLSIVGARRSALLRLGHRGPEWLSHLQRHQPPELPTICIENRGGPAHT